MFTLMISQVINYLFVMILRLSLFTSIFMVSSGIRNTKWCDLYHGIVASLHITNHLTMYMYIFVIVFLLLIVSILSFCLQYFCSFTDYCFVNPPFSIMNPDCLISQLSMNKHAFKDMVDLLYRGNLAFVPNLDPTKGWLISQIDWKLLVI